MTKDVFHIVVLMIFVLIGCLYHEELADIVGLILNKLFINLG
jgi:hypothetical protein